MFERCVVALLAAFVVVVKSEDACDLESLQACAANIEVRNMFDSMNLDENFPDEEFLNEYCGPVIELLECIHGVRQKCPELAAIIDVVAVNIPSVIDALHSICDDDSEFKIGYLANVECYDRALPQINECAGSVTEALGEFYEAVRNDTEASATLGDLDPFCIDHQFIFNCAVEEATTLCGEEGAEPLSDILDTVSSFVKQAGCNDQDLLAWELKLLEYILEKGLQELLSRK